MEYFCDSPYNFDRNSVKLSFEMCKVIHSKKFLLLFYFLKQLIIIISDEYSASYGNLISFNKTKFFYIRNIDLITVIKKISYSKLVNLIHGLHFGS